MFFDIDILPGSVKNCMLQGVDSFSPNSSITCIVHLTTYTHQFSWYTMILAPDTDICVTHHVSSLLDFNLPAVSSATLSTCFLNI